MKQINIIIIMACLLGVQLFSACSFLDQQKPQGVLSDELVKDPAYVDQLVNSAYAIFMTAEDINSSFSMWNYDVRSDDAYKGGIAPSDGDVFHNLEVQSNVQTSAWNISDMWGRLYNCLSRVNTAISLLEKSEDSKLTQTRLGEMYFLRAYGHFLLKRLYKNIPFVIDPNMSNTEYNKLSNTQYSNDEGWALIADDLRYAFQHLPAKQAEVGRANKSAAAALLAKVYMYKAYRQDDPLSHRVTSVDAADLDSAIYYTDPQWYTGYGLEPDFHNNFRPETQYENGIESIWAIQYSMNDGTKNGNMNWSYGLIVPNIPGVTDGGCDFYKPSQNLVNAYKTDINGLPVFEGYNKKNFELKEDFADPRLFLTVGIAGCPYEFNSSLIMDKSKTWSRSNGRYGYNVSLKHNVDPASGYLVKGGWWGSPMNRIVLRYADVLLLRAEALCQRDRSAEAIQLVNELRQRAKTSAESGIIADYGEKYGARMNIASYAGSYSAERTLEIVKKERRLELAMESERFFDLVRWGDAKQVLDTYFAEEASRCDIYNNAIFPENKGEYLPIPFSQIAASNNHYTQNIGGW